MLLLFEDDVVLVADSVVDLQRKLDICSDHFVKIGYESQHGHIKYCRFTKWRVLKES